MSSVALSTFARVQQDLAATRRAVLSATRLTALVALPVFAGMALAAPEMISTLVGARWASAVPVLRALCPSGLVLCLTYLDRSLIVAVGRPRTALVLSGLGVALRLVGYVIGVQFGVVGVAVGLTVTSIMYWPCRVMVLRNLTGVSLAQYARQLKSAAVSTGTMILALLLLHSVLSGHVDDAVLLCAKILVGVAAYVIPLALVDRASVQEIVDLVRLMSKRSRGSTRS
jgi:O-antigen/teichoic acid export membrane protein